MASLLGMAIKKGRSKKEQKRTKKVQKRTKKKLAARGGSRTQALGAYENFHRNSRHSDAVFWLPRTIPLGHRVVTVAGAVLGPGGGELLEGLRTMLI